MKFDVTERIGPMQSQTPEGLSVVPRIADCARRD
jgi:hypothetical protein